MPRKIYVANLHHPFSPGELERMFAAHGTVRSAEVDNRADVPGVTGTARVEMDTDGQGAAAIAALNGTLHDGCALVVGWAEPDDASAAAGPPMFGPMNMPAGEGGAPGDPTPCRVPCPGPAPGAARDWVGTGSDSEDPIAAHAHPGVDPLGPPPSGRP